MNRRRQNGRRRHAGSLAGRKEWAGAQPERKQAEGYIRWLHEDEFPEKRLIDLLRYAVKNNPPAAKLMVERIRRNQAEKLSPEDLIFLQEIEAELAKQGCAVGQ